MGRGVDYYKSSVSPPFSVLQDRLLKPVALRSGIKFAKNLPMAVLQEMYPKVLDPTVEYPVWAHHGTDYRPTVSPKSLREMGEYTGRIKVR